MRRRSMRDSQSLVPGVKYEERGMDPHGNGRAEWTTKSQAGRQRIDIFLSIARRLGRRPCLTGGPILHLARFRQGWCSLTQT